jgi:hypothetical protein
MWSLMHAVQRTHRRQTWWAVSPCPSHLHRIRELICEVHVGSNDVVILSETLIYLSSAEAHPGLNALSSASKMVLRVDGQMDKQCEAEVVFTMNT